MTRRVMVALILVAAAACGTGAGPSTEVEAASTGPGPHCGYERWAVKTGQDALVGSVNLTPKPSTIADLSLLPTPLPPVPNGHFPPQVQRKPAEESTYTVSGFVIAYRSENDSDIHLVISDGAKHTLITEIPDPRCMGASPWVPQVTAARAAFLAVTGYKPVAWTSKKRPPAFVKPKHPLAATVTGVAFFDFPHAQYGAAPNAVELHPILAITFP